MISLLTSSHLPLNMYLTMKILLNKRITIKFLFCSSCATVSCENIWSFTPSVIFIQNHVFLDMSTIGFKQQSNIYLQVKPIKYLLASWMWAFFSSCNLPFAVRHIMLQLSLFLKHFAYIMLMTHHQTMPSHIVSPEEVCQCQLTRVSIQLRPKSNQ